MEAAEATLGLPSAEQGADRGDVRDREIASVALAFLYAAGGTLGLTALLLPHSAIVDVSGVAGICIAALPIAALLLVLRPLPWWVLHVALALGMLMITGAVVFSNVLAGGYAFYYLWIVLFASYFFSRPGAIAQISFLAAVYAAIIAFSDGPSEWGLGWLLTIGSLIVAAVLVRGLKERLDRLVVQLSHAATTDDLSGLLNRRGFNQIFGEELRRASRSDRGLAIVVGDLDHFKQVNDRYGHPAGDEALRRVSALLHEAARVRHGRSARRRGVCARPPLHGATRRSGDGRADSGKRS